MKKQKVKSKKSIKQFFVIAHNLRSLHNVGSVFRTADAFGVTKIFLTGYTGTPENPAHNRKITKTALGAEKFVPWEYKRSAVKLIKELKNKKVQIVALENNLNNIRKPKINLSHTFHNPPAGGEEGKIGIAIVLGEEVKGIRKDILKLCDAVMEIPMSGKKESLNVSVAFGIAAYVISLATKI